MYGLNAVILIGIILVTVCNEFPRVVVNLCLVELYRFKVERCGFDCWVDSF